MIYKLFYNLFYPWISAHFWAAYTLYAQSDEYIAKLRYGGTKLCTKYFLNHGINDYLTLAVRKYWLEILVSPWNFGYHPDFDGEEIE